MLPASSRIPQGDEPGTPASRHETLELIGRDLLLLQDSCHLLRLACQSADYDAAAASETHDA